MRPNESPSGREFSQTYFRSHETTLSFVRNTRLLSFLVLPHSAFEPGACTGRTTIVPAAIVSTGKKPRKFTKQPNRAPSVIPVERTRAVTNSGELGRIDVFVNTLCSVTSARRVLPSADGAKIFHTIPRTHFERRSGWTFSHRCNVV